jgi:hypothetical protein
MDSSKRRDDCYPWFIYGSSLRILAPLSGRRDYCYPWLINGSSLRYWLLYQVGKTISIRCSYIGVHFGNWLLYKVEETPAFLGSNMGFILDIGSSIRWQRRFLSLAHHLGY